MLLSLLGCHSKSDVIESKKSGKDKESIQPSITPDPGYHMGKWQKQLNITNKRSAPFPAGDNKAAMNIRESMKNTRINNTTIHKRSTALERSVKYFTGGFKPVSQRQPHP